MANSMCNFLIRVSVRSPWPHALSLQLSTGSVLGIPIVTYPEGFSNPLSLSMAQKPQIAVIVPAYNAERTIARTLESVANQTFRDIEIAVVNDGSTDGTASEVAKFAAQDARVKMVSQGNLGVAAARNSGVRNTSAPFVAPIDADDVWHPTKLEKQFDRMIRDENVGLVYAWYRLIDVDDNVYRSQFTVRATGRVFPLMIQTNFIGNGSSPLIRRQLLERVGCYDTSLHARDAQGCEDWKMQLLLAEICEFDLVPEFLIGYRRSDGNMSSNTAMMARSKQLVLDEMRQRHAPLPPDIIRSISASALWREAGYLVRHGQPVNAMAKAAQAMRLDPFGTLISAVEAAEAKTVVALRQVELVNGPFATISPHDAGWVGRGYGLRRKQRRACSMAAIRDVSAETTATRLA
jgi:hypothetical protein